MNKFFRVIICGSSEFNDYNKLRDTCDRLLSYRIEKGENIVVYTGGIKGAEALGEKYAKERGFDLKLVAPDWERFGSKANKFRCNKFTDEANACVAFIIGKTDIGTEIMLGNAKRKKLLIREIKIEKE